MDREYRDRLVLANRGLVVTISRDYLGHRLLVRDDLIQAGQLGLVEAAGRFDPKRGKFGAYARHWIRLRMSEYRAEVLGQFSIAMPEMHFHGVGGSDGESSETPFLQAQPDPDAERGYERLHSSDELLFALARLAHREAIVVMRRSALVLPDVPTYVEIGEELGISHETARKLEHAGLAQLREALAA